MKKSLKDEALDSLKAIGSSKIDAKSPPSPVQALLGAISAGVIAVILYKFTTTIEAALNRQTISDSYSVRSLNFHFVTITQYSIVLCKQIIYCHKLSFNHFASLHLSLVWF